MKSTKINHNYSDNSSLGSFLWSRSVQNVRQTYNPIEYCCLSPNNRITDPNLINQTLIVINSDTAAKWHQKNKWSITSQLLIRLPKSTKTPLSIKTKPLTKDLSIMNENLDLSTSIACNNKGYGKDNHVYLYQKPTINEIFYTNRKKVLQIKEKSGKKYVWHSTALLSLLALLSVTAQNFIPVMSVSRSLREFGKITNQLNVSAARNETLQKQINVLKAKTKQRQAEIKNTGQQLVQSITQGNTTLEEALNKLQKTIDEQNNQVDSHSPILDVDIDTATSLLKTMEDKKTKLLDTYVTEVTDALTKQNKETEKKLNELLNVSGGSFSNLSEDSQNKIKDEVKRLNQEIAQDADDFFKQIKNDINQYKESMQIYIADSKNSGITSEVLKEILHIADEELGDFIQTQIWKNSQELLNKAIVRRRVMAQTVLETTTQKSKEQMMHSVNDRNMPDNLKNQFQNIIANIWGHTGVSIETLNPKKDIITQLDNINKNIHDQAQIAKQELPGLDSELKRIKKQGENYYSGGMYGFCNEGRGWGGWWAAFKHVGTLGVCSTYTVGYNVAGTAKGYGLDWNGIFNIVNAASLVMDIVMIATGVGAIATVVKTAAKVGATHALKTATKIVAKQVVKTAFMAGAGASIGETTGVGSGTGAMIGASMSLGSISKLNIVSRATANVATRNTSKLAQQASKILTTTKRVVGNVVKETGSSATRAGVGAVVGGGLSYIAGDDVEKGALAGAALSGAVMATTKGINRSLSTKSTGTLSFSATP